MFPLLPHSSLSENGRVPQCDEAGKHPNYVEKHPNSGVTRDSQGREGSG